MVMLDHGLQLTWYYTRFISISAVIASVSSKTTTYAIAQIVQNNLSFILFINVRYTT